MLDPAQLRAYIDDDTHYREKECQPFLEAIARHLCSETPTRILLASREEVSRFGYADFSVSALFTGSAIERVAYVWEVKAPQVALMEFDRAGRFTPTSELISAETQLLHYVNEFRDSPSFRAKFDLDADAEVRPAGIVIGRWANFASFGRAAGDQHSLLRQARQSLLIRQRYIYDRIPVRIKTWDWVYDRAVEAQGSPQPLPAVAP